MGSFNVKYSSMRETARAVSKRTKKGLKSHGKPGKRIVKTKIIDGVLHELHATKGWRKSRVCK